MNRRLEGPHLDTARLDNAGREAQRAEGLRCQGVGLRRLNEVGKSAARSPETSAAPRSGQADATGLRTSGSAPGKSLDEALTDFVMPRLEEPAILRRSVPILQDCLTHLVPGLEGGEQLRSLASTLMEDELERHRNLLGHLQGGTDS